MSRAQPDLLVLGRVLRQLRERRGWTQDQLSIEAAPLTQSIVSDSERGQRNLSFETLERWLAALGVTWEAFGQALDREARQRPPQP